MHQWIDLVQIGSAFITLATAVVNLRSVIFTRRLTANPDDQQDVRNQRPERTGDPQNPAIASQPWLRTAAGSRATSPLRLLPARLAAKANGTVRWIDSAVQRRLQHCCLQLPGSFSEDAPNTQIGAFPDHNLTMIGTIQISGSARGFLRSATRR